MYTSNVSSRLNACQIFILLCAVYYAAVMSQIHGNHIKNKQLVLKS